MTALHHAAYCNDPGAIRAALRQGIPVDVRDDGAWTPLCWSVDMAQAWGEPVQAVSLLLAAGASPNAVDNAGRSVLMLACGRGNEAILARLLEAGADAHARSGGTTPLHQAAGSNFIGAIRTLLALGVDPAITDARGLTPEERAEECGFDESVAVLRAARSTASDASEQTRSGSR
ncbi:MAG: ankyrin repeat domain-containing protein [Polyangiales bacterium]